MSPFQRAVMEKLLAEDAYISEIRWRVYTLHHPSSPKRCDVPGMSITETRIPASTVGCLIAKGLIREGKRVAHGRQYVGCFIADPLPSGYLPVEGKR